MLFSCVEDFTRIFSFYPIEVDEQKSSNLTEWRISYPNNNFKTIIMIHSNHIPYMNHHNFLYIF